MICKKCGSQLDDNEIYCKNCGSNVVMQKEKKKPILFGTFSGITILIIVFIIYLIIQCFSVFGAFAAFGLLIVYRIAYYLLYVIIGLWLFYFIIKLVIFINNKYLGGRKIITVMVILGLLLVVYIGVKCYISYKDKSADVNKVILASCGCYCDDNHYFIYNDKIYYTKKDSFSKEAKFYKMDFDGKNNTFIASFYERGYVYFFFVYDDYAYFYTCFDEYNRRIEKINLETGEIVDTNINGEIIPLTFNKGTVSTILKGHNYTNSYFYFYKYDLNTDSKMSYTKIDTIPSLKLLDYDNRNIYYIEDNEKPSKPELYKNSEKIYKFADEKKFLMLKDSFVYMYDKDKIYKIDTLKKQIVGEYKLLYNDIVKIESGNNKDNYFYSNNVIYTYDFSEDKFLKVVDNVSKSPDYVYNTDKYIIFQTKRIEGDGSINRVGNVILYDKDTKKVEVFNNVRKLSFDNNYAYLLILTEDSYYIKKISI